jgi:hypothetical protein
MRRSLAEYSFSGDFSGSSSSSSRSFEQFKLQQHHSRPQQCAHKRVGTSACYTTLDSSPYTCSMKSMEARLLAVSIPTSLTSNHPSTYASQERDARKQI